MSQRFAVRGSPMLPVPRPAHLKKKQEKDGWTEVEEFVEVDVNGNELFAKTTKQANLEKYFCKICKFASYTRHQYQEHLDSYVHKRNVL